MAWSDAFTGLAGVVQTVLHRIWGTQTRVEAQTEDAGEKALERAKNAQSADELSAALSDLERLYHEAANRNHR